MVNLITRKPRISVVACKACNYRGKRFEEVFDLKEEPIRPDVFQIKVVCRHCGDSTHAYFDTPTLKAEKERIAMKLAAYQADRKPETFEAYKNAREVYGRHFEDHNKRWARKIGIGKARDQNS